MRAHDERGVMMIQAIVLMSLLSIAVATAAAAIAARATVVRSTAQALQASYAAESGIAWTIAMLREGGLTDRVAHGRIEHCSWEVAVTREPTTGETRLESIGDCSGRRQRLVYAARGPKWDLRPLE